MPTLAERLGTTSHLSPLLQKAKSLGLRCGSDLEDLAVSRGLSYFGKSDLSVPDSSRPRTITAEWSRIPATRPEDPKPNCLSFSNEELAIALMSPSLPYSLKRLRMAAAMLGADGIESSKILELARKERCEPIVRYLAGFAAAVEPHVPLWNHLLRQLPPTCPPKTPDVLPALSRLTAISGITRLGRTPSIQWVRPTP